MIYNFKEFFSNSKDKQLRKWAKQRVFASFRLHQYKNSRFFEIVATMPPQCNTLKYCISTRFTRCGIVATI